MESCLLYRVCVVRGSSDYSRSYEVRNADKQHLYGDPVGDSSNESKQSYCPQHTHTDTPWSSMRMLFLLYYIHILVGIYTDLARFLPSKVLGCIPASWSRHIVSLKMALPLPRKPSRG